MGAEEEIAEELVKARMLAAEREHEIVELSARLQRYENEFIDLNDEEEDQLDATATELWLSGNEYISQGDISQGVTAYTSSMSSLLRRFQDLKSRVQARDLAQAEMKRKWMGEKDEEVARAVRELDLNKRELELAKEEEAALQVELHEEKKARQALEEEVTQERTKLQQALDQVVQVQEEGGAQLEQVKQELDTCKQELEACKQELQASKQELDTCKQELDASKQELDTCKQDLDTCKQELQASKQGQTTQLDQVKQALDEAHTKLAAHEDQTKQLLQKHLSLKEEHKLVRQAVQSKEEELQQVRIELEQCRANVVAMQDENVNLGNDIFELQAECAQLKQNRGAEMAALVEQVSAGELALAQLQATASQTQHEILGLQQELVAREGELRAQYEQILRAAQMDFEFKQQELMDENAMLDAAVQAKQHELDAAVQAKQHDLEYVMQAKQQELESALLAKQQELESAMRAKEQEVDAAVQAKQQELESVMQTKQQELKSALQAKQQEEMEAMEQRAASQLQQELARVAQEAQAAKDELETKLYEQEAAVLAKQQEVELAQQAVRDARAEVLAKQEELDAARAQMGDENARLNAAVDELQSQVNAAVLAEQAANAQLASVRAQLETSLADLATKTAQLDQAQTENIELSDQVFELQAEVQQLVAQGKPKAAEGEDERVTQLQAELDQCKLDLSTARARVEKIQTEAKARMQKTRNEAAALVSKTKEESAALQARVEEELAGKLAENAQLQARMEEMVKGEEALRAQCAELQSRGVEAEEKLDALRVKSREEMAEVEAKLAASWEEIAALRQELQVAKTDLQSQMERAEREELALNTRVANLQAQMDAMQLETDKLRGAVEATQSENIALNETVFELQAAAQNNGAASVAEDNAQFAELNQQVFALEQELSPLRLSVINLKDKVHVLERELSQAQQHESMAASANAMLESDLQGLQAWANAARLDVQALQLGLAMAEEHALALGQEKCLCEIALDAAQTELERERALRKQSQGTRRALNLVCNEERLRELEMELANARASASAGEQTAYLEQELKRSRAEYNFNTKNLQAECDALRRRLEEIGLEQESRRGNRSGSVDYPPSSTKKRPIGSSTSSKRVGFAPPMETPESLRGTRARRNSLPNASEVAELVSLVPLAEVRRERNEFALASKNLQSECDALRRRVEELELELAAKSEAMQLQQQMDVQPEALKRTVSEAESQRRHPVMALPLETPESRSAFMVAQTTGSASPVAFRLDVDEEEEKEEEREGREARLQELRIKLVEREAALRDCEARVKSLERELEAQRHAPSVSSEMESVSVPRAASPDLISGEEEIARLEARVRFLEHQIPKEEEVDALLARLTTSLHSAAARAPGGDGADLVSSATVLVDSVRALETEKRALKEQLAAMLGAEVEEDGEESEALMLVRQITSQAASAASAMPSQAETLDVDQVISQVRECLRPRVPLSAEEEEDGGFVEWAKAMKQLQREKRDLANRLLRAEAELATRVEFFSQSRLYGADVSLANSSGIGGESHVLQTPVRRGDDGERSLVTPWKNAAFSNSTRSSVASNWSRQAATPAVGQLDWNPPQEEWTEQQQQQEWTEQQQQQEWTEQQQQGWTEQQQQEWTEQQQQEWTEQQQQEWTEQQQQQGWTEQQQQEWTEQQQLQWIQQEWPEQQQQPVADEHQQQQQEPVPVQAEVPSTLAPPQQQQQQAAPAKKEMRKSHRAVGPSVLAVALGIGSYHPEWKPNPEELEEDNSDFEDEQQAPAPQQPPLPPPQDQGPSAEDWFQPPPVVEYEPHGSWQGEGVAEPWTDDTTWQQQQQQQEPAAKDWSAQQQPEQQEGGAWTEHADHPPAYIEQTPQKRSSFNNQDDFVSPAVVVDVHEFERLTKRLAELKEELALEREARLLRESQSQSFEAKLSTVLHEAEVLKSELYGIESKHQDEMEELQEQLQAARKQTVAIAPAPAPVPEAILSMSTTTTLIAQQESVVVMMDHNDEREQECKELEFKLGEALETIHAMRAQILQLQTTPPPPPPAQQQQEESTPDAAAPPPTLAAVAEEGLRREIALRERDVTKLVAQLSTVTYELLSAEEQAERSNPATTISLAVAAFALSAMIPPQAIVQRVIELFHMI